MDAWRDRHGRRTLTTDRSQERAWTLALAVPEVLVADALSRVLREAGFRVVGCHADVDALIGKLRPFRPDLAVIEAPIEGHDGRSEALARLRQAGGPTMVVALARSVDAPLARALVRYGVRGLILRSTPAMEAVALLRQVAEGQVVFPSAVMQHLSGSDELAELSLRQLEVLELLALGASNGEIARRLYISPNTVKFHVREIYTRLGVHNRVEAARLVQRRAA
jgi:DNA-binding NarL/FixJ family response regulator